MTQEWHPNMRRELLSGLTARAWGLVGGLVMLVFALAFGTLMVGIALSTLGVTSTNPPYFYVTFAVFTTCALLIGRGPFSPIMWVAERREKQERAAGYTTAASATYEKDVAVDVVDPRSRRVIRMAHEPLVESKYFADQQEQIRERLLLVREAALEESLRTEGGSGDRRPW